MATIPVKRHFKPFMTFVKAKILEQNPELTPYVNGLRGATIDFHEVVQQGDRYIARAALSIGGAQGRFEPRNSISFTLPVFTLSSLLEHLGYQQDTYNDTQQQDIIRSLPDGLVGRYNSKDATITISIDNTKYNRNFSINFERENGNPPASTLSLIEDTAKPYNLRLLPTVKRDLHNIANSSSITLSDLDYVEPIA